jgi:hypothetical protein
MGVRTHYNKSKLKAEIADNFRQFAGTDLEKQLEAASTLGKLGVWSRGSVRPRGTLEVPAENRFPEPQVLQSLIDHLPNGSSTLQQKIIAALGEWAGRDALNPISEILRASKDEQTRLYCVTALGCIGGPGAVAELREATVTGTELVRIAAVTAIEGLRTGGATEDLEGPSECTTGPGNSLTLNTPINWESIIKQLDPDKRKRRKLKLLVTTLTSCAPEVSWDRHLIEIAHQYKWPRWAVEALPTRLIVEMKGSTWLLWDRLLEVLPKNSAKVKMIDKKCSGVIREIKISQSLHTFVRRTCSTIDDDRRYNPYSSNRSVEGTFTHALATAELDLKRQSSISGSRRVAYARKAAAKKFALPVRR